MTPSEEPSVSSFYEKRPCSEHESENPLAATLGGRMGHDDNQAAVSHPNTDSRYRKAGSFSCKQCSTSYTDVSIPRSPTPASPLTHEISCLNLPVFNIRPEQPSPNRPISPLLLRLIHIPNDERPMANPKGDVDSGASLTHRIPRLHPPRHNDIKPQEARSNKEPLPSLSIFPNLLPLQESKHTYH